MAVSMRPQERVRLFLVWERTFARWNLVAPLEVQELPLAGNLLASMSHLADLAEMCTLNVILLPHPEPRTGEGRAD